MYWFAIPNIGSVLKGLSQVTIWPIVTKLDARTVKTTFYLTLCLAHMEGEPWCNCKIFPLQLVGLSSNHGNNLSSFGVKVTYIWLRPSSNGSLCTGFPVCPYVLAPFDKNYENLNTNGFGWCLIYQSESSDVWPINIIQGRKELLSFLNRTKYKEMMLAPLEKKRLKLSPLDMRFHLRDLIGSGRLKTFHTPTGLVVRLVKD